MPKVGDVLAVSLKLFDANPSKYVLATVKDSDNNHLPGSPVTLPHIELGRYETDIFVMPITDYVTATYQVFDDALMIIPSSSYTDGTDVFALDVPDADILAKLNEIITYLLALLGQGINVQLTGAIDLANNLIGFVEENPILTGTVKEEFLLGMAELESNIKSVVDSNDDLSGDIET